MDSNETRLLERRLERRLERLESDMYAMIAMCKRTNEMMISMADTIGKLGNSILKIKEEVDLCGKS